MNDKMSNKELIDLISGTSELASQTINNVYHIDLSRESRTLLLSNLNAIVKEINVVRQELQERD